MILNWLFRKRRAIPLGQPRPDEAFYAIGDMHGRLDLLRPLLDKLDPALPVLCVGDYVDRGEDSAGVLRLLHNRPGFTCLRGNHEDMMLGFLDDPQAQGPRWLYNGGIQTLASFGITGVTAGARGIELDTVRNVLAMEMGTALIDWLRDLPLCWTSGNIAVVHAGADPAKPIASQSPKHLLWGHPAFARKARTDGIWVVHGHTIVDNATALDGRIALDTGAFATNHLTAARISSDGVSFVST